MNNELLNQVANLIEEVDRFDLAYWVRKGEAGGESMSFSARSGELLHNCKTTACVAGWTCVLLAGEDSTVRINDDAERIARVALDLTLAESYRLFLATERSVWAGQANRFGWRTAENDGLVDWSEVTAAQAATVLREVASGVIPL